MSLQKRDTIDCKPVEVDWHEHSPSTHSKWPVLYWKGVHQGSFSLYEHATFSYEVWQLLADMAHVTWGGESAITISWFIYADLQMSLKITKPKASGFNCRVYIDTHHRSRNCWRHIVNLIIRAAAVPYSGGKSVTKWSRKRPKFPFDLRLAVQACSFCVVRIISYCAPTHLSVHGTSFVHADESLGVAIYQDHHQDMSLYLSVYPHLRLWTKNAARWYIIKNALSVISCLLKDNKPCNQDTYLLQTFDTDHCYRFWS